MDHIGLTRNIINITLYAVQRKNYCIIFLLTFGTPHMGNIPTYYCLHILWSIRILEQRSWDHFIVSYEVSMEHPYDLRINLIQ